MANACAFSLACNTEPSPSIRAASARDSASALALPVLSTAMLQGKQSQGRPRRDARLPRDLTGAGTPSVTVRGQLVRISSILSVCEIWLGGKLLHPLSSCWATNFNFLPILGIKPQALSRLGPFSTTKPHSPSGVLIYVSKRALLASQPQPA